ncbi:MAG: DUF4199 domain-containing protein [Candidatus Cryptobacteroides sp.]
MKETVTNKAILNLSSIAGLALGGVSVAYLLISENITEWISSAVAVSVINMILWIAKFVGCIALMKFFMRKLVQDYDEVKTFHTLKLGIVSAAFSALLYSAASLADMLYINPESINEAYDLAMSAYSSILDSNTLRAMEQVKGSLPTISFFSNLIYCFLYGFVLSSILSRNIPIIDPFADFHRNENNGDSQIDEQ